MCVAAEMRASVGWRTLQSVWCIEPRCVSVLLLTSRGVLKLHGGNNAVTICRYHGAVKVGFDGKPAAAAPLRPGRGTAARASSGKRAKKASSSD